MNGNEFYIINRKGVKTLCALKRGQLHACDTVHIVGGFCDGDTGWTLDEVRALTGDKALTIEWNASAAPDDQPVDYRCKFCGKPISAAEGDDNDGSCDDHVSLSAVGWDFGGGVDDPRY